MKPPTIVIPDIKDRNWTPKAGRPVRFGRARVGEYHEPVVLAGGRAARFHTSRAGCLDAGRQLHQARHLLCLDQSQHRVTNDVVVDVAHTTTVVASSPPCMSRWSACQTRNNGISGLAFHL